MKKRSLFAAVAMLLVSAVLLTSATYAWFTAGGDGTITNVKGSVMQADTGVMLQAYNTGWVGTLDLGTNNANFATLFATGTDYAGQMPGTLKPLSTVDGKAFVTYTLDNASKLFKDEALNSSNYIEYKFDVAAVTDGASVTAYPTIGGGAAQSARVALLEISNKGQATESETLVDTWAYDSTSATTEAITLNSGAARELDTLGVKDDGTGTGATAWVLDSTDTNFDAAYVQTVTSKVAGGNTGNKASLGTFAKNAYDSNATVKNYVVRVWIEGQDADCQPNGANCPGKDVTVSWTFQATNPTV